MKKITLLLILILIPFTYSITECPIGEVNCEYPGDCTLYTDTNKDELCDFSQNEINTQTINIENIEHIELTGQDLKTMTVEQIAQIYSIDKQTYANALQKYYNGNIEPTDSFQKLHDNLGVEPSVAKDIAIQIATGSTQILKEETKESIAPQKPKYEIIYISILTIISYFFTYSLYKTNVITLINHRRFWNWILLITFLISSILGLLLVIRINYQLSFNPPFNMLYLHVEAGIVMTIISLFHTFWHIRYYLGTFKKTTKV